jgi:flavin reductase (DIM6/NTAB) family NADH-FMN oxidoreductase RutF
MPIDPNLYRQVASCFASGVTIITSGEEGAYHGMTASAFTSLSLNPPMVLVCVDRGARTLGVIESSGFFNVNILAGDQEDVSRRFAKRSEPGEDGMRDTVYTLGKLGAPRIKGALAYFECRVALRYDGGDHVIFVGAVEGGEIDDEAEPLLYFQGKYRALAQP